MKLNQKGYMLVEIIISFTLAMGIAYYLLNLTYKFKNMDEDIYMSTIFSKDKIAITKNIMNDIDRGTISNIVLAEDNNSITFDLEINNSSLLSDHTTEKRKITLDKNNRSIEYGKIKEDGTYETSDVSYYYKTISDSLTINGFEININEDESIRTCFSIIIKISSIYDNNDYNIKLFGQIG